MVAELSGPAVAAQAGRRHWHGSVGRSHGRPLGFGGFKSSPNDLGEVQIGYLKPPPFEGQGVVTAIMAATIAIAKRENAAAVRANTLAAKNSSTAVFRYGGQVLDGESHDPDKGVVWRRRLDL